MKMLITLIFTSILTINTFAAEFITIGTGGVTGTYYPTGQALCKFVNKYKKESKIRCSIESTAGSVYNVNTINLGELDFGIAQSDIVYQAINAKGVFKNNPIKKLKSVMAIYPELLTLVTRKDSNINKLEDIKGKRINLGNPGSGNEATTMLLLESNNIKKSDLLLAATYKASEMPDALRDKKIDGYFYMVGHPTANIKDAANSVDINIVELDTKYTDLLISKYPYFTKSNIAANLYRNQKNQIQTIGVKALLIVNEDIDKNTVYLLTKAILENFEEFKKIHPAYSKLTKESLLEGLSAPLHEGAIKYYKEIGLL